MVPMYLPKVPQDPAGDALDRGFCFGGQAGAQCECGALDAVTGETTGRAVQGTGQLDDIGETERMRAAVPEMWAERV
jgi:hypothetical protein